MPETKKKSKHILHGAVDVRRGNRTERIPAGTLVSETDLTEAEIAQLTREGAIRKPTAEELLEREQPASSDEGDES